MLNRVEATNVVRKRLEGEPEVPEATRTKLMQDLERDFDAIEARGNASRGWTHQLADGLDTPLAEG